MDDGTKTNDSKGYELSDGVFAYPQAPDEYLNPKGQPIGIDDLSIFDGTSSGINVLLITVW